MKHPAILKRFVVFEGIDGSGTSTQLMHIIRECENQKVKAFATREPTTSPMGCIIDSFLKKKISLAPQTVTRLFATDRCEHIYGKEGIIKMLEKGIVISDRYLFSSLAYQGAANGDLLAKSENSSFPLPQALFFFDLPVEIAMKRIEKRAELKELYEKEAFLKVVQENYLALIKEYQTLYPEMKIIHINASLQEDVVFGKIKKSFEELGFL